MSDAIFKTAPYNPPHLFVADTLYMLTASIYKKADLIKSSQRKAEWRDAFLEAAKIYQWQIIAWVVLNNHYQAIVQSPERAANLSKFINIVVKKMILKKSDGTRLGHVLGVDTHQAQDCRGLGRQDFESLLDGFY